MATITVPVWKDTMLYTGTAQSPNSSTYWASWTANKYTFLNGSWTAQTNTISDDGWDGGSGSIYYTVTLRLISTSDRWAGYPTGQRNLEVRWRIKQRVLDIPQWIGGTLTYDGTEKNVYSGTYWSDWNTNYWTPGGVWSATDVSDGLDYEGYLTAISHDENGTEVFDTIFPYDMPETVLQWNLSPLAITLPAWTSTSTYTYNGSTQGPPSSNINTTYCAVSGYTTAQTDAGNYDVDVELISTLNTYWSDGTTTTKTITWTINPVTLTIAPTAKYIEYTGSAIDVSQNLTTYWNNWTATYGWVAGNQKVATNAGTYQVRLQCNSNYQFSSSISDHSNYYDTTWTISLKPVTPPSWKSNLVYSGSEYDIDNTSYWNNWNTTYCYILGRVAATDAGTYNVTFECNSNYIFNTNPQSTQVSRTWTIDRSATVSIPEWNSSLYYKGSAYDVSNPSDGYWLNWNNTTYCTISGSTTGTNAGAYSVTFTCKSNYAFTNSATTASATWLIQRKVISPPTWIANLTYSGSSYSADNSLYWSGWNSSEATISAGSGGTLTATNAGTYTVRFTCTSNYTYSSSLTATCNWTINKYSVTLPTWTRNGATETYDTYNWALSITNPAVTRDTTHTQIDSSSTGTSPQDQCGTYYVNIDLVNTTNYQWSNGTTTRKQLMWRIEPLYIAGPTWKSASLTYTGSSQSAAVNNYWTWAYNVNDTTKFTQSSTWSATNAGNYTARISIASAHRNQVYFNSNDNYVDCTWTIDKYSGWGFNGIDLTGRTATDWVSFTALTALQPSTITISTTSTHIELSSSSGYKVRRIGSWDGHSYNSYVNCTTTDTNFVTSGADCYVSSAVWDDKTPSWTVSPTTLALKMHGSDASKTSTITKGTETYLTYDISNSSSTIITATLSGSTITATSKAVGSATISVTSEEYNSTSTYRYRPQKSINISVTVSNNQVSAPEWKTNCVYDTFEFNTASSTYWTNWDTTYFTYIAADFKKTNAGTYPVTFTCKAGYEFTNEGPTANRNWIIEKAKVTKPSISGTSAFTYNWGVALGPVTVVADLDKVDITGDTGTKTVVGTYTIVGALHDANNYEWTDGTSADVNLHWNVFQLILTPPSAQSGTLTYNGSAQSPSWDVTIDSHISISGNSQTNAGSYTATFTIPTRYGTNATWSTGVSSVTCGWSIGKKSWSTNNNSDMTYYDISSIDLSVLLNDTYARDGFTAARTSGDDCVNISGTTISRKGSHTSSSKTATLTITANGNYTPSAKTCTVTIAIWQEGSWSITPTVLNTVPNSTLSNAITINNYFSTMVYEITPGSLTVTRNGNKLTIKTPASANSYTGKISNDDFMDTSTFTHYASVEKSFTVHSYTIVNSPNWKNNNPEWTGNTITVSGTTYWDTWDTTKYTVSGNSASTVGSHIATFTANSPYWLDSIGTTSVNKTWYIATQKVPLPYWNSGAPSKTYNWGATISVADSEYTYDSRCNKGGQTSGTTVGTYAITFTLKNTTNYEWVTGGTAIKALEWNIITLRIAQPELAAEIVFNNTEQTATWTPTYSTTRVTADGQLKGTLGGKYTATFTITSSYYPNAKWEDAETAQISVDWYIDKLGLASPTTSSSLVYNGDFQSPTWSQSSDVTAYTTNNNEAETDAGNYSTTWTIKSNFDTSVYWEATSGLTLTINWSIAKKSNWGVVDNDDLTDYGVNSIDLQTIFTGVYARDLSEFTFAYSAASGYNDCVSFDIQGQVIKTKSSVPLGSAQMGRYSVTPNGNYTATPVKNVLISAAHWKTDGTWNVNPNSFNTVPNTEYYALITSYNSHLTYTLNKGSLSSFTRTDDQLTLTTSSTLGTYTATISTAAYNDKTIYTHYNAITRSISINCRNIITSPTWKDNNPQWTGEAIDVSGNTYWNNWNTNLDTSGLSATTVGSHTATFSVHAGDNYWLDTVGTTSVNRTWSIVKRIVSLPHLTAAYSDKVYNWGSTITIGTNEYEYDTTYSLEGSDTQTSGTNVGTYGLTFVLIDTNTCVWNDAQQTTTKKIVEWHINPLILTKPTQNGSLTYNGASQTPQWNDFPASVHVTTEGSAAGTNAGSYTLTFKIDPIYSGAGWDVNLTKDYTATWTIDKKTWSTANNTSMTARTTNAVGYGALLNNSVYSRDFADFTFALKSGSPDYTNVDTTNSQITKDTSKPWDGASKVDTYVITPNSNYVSGTKEVKVTVAIWKTETWSLSKTSIIIIGTNADTVTINNYSSNIPSSNWTLTPTPSSNAPFSYARSGQTITITGVSTGNGSLKVASTAYEYATSFIYYDAHNETITITINAKLDPTWTVSKNLLECTYAPSGTVTDTATVNDIQSGITISVNSSAVPSGQGSVSYTNATITYTAAFGSSYYESQKNVVVSSAATATYNAKSVTIKVVNHRATQPLMTVSPWESSVSVQVDSTVNAQTIPTAPEGSYTVTTSSYYTTNITGGKLKITGVKGTNGQTCTVSIAQTTNYNAASRSFTVIVTKKAQTWTISNVALRQGESTTITLTGNISSGQRRTGTNPTGVAVVTLSDVVITILATGSTGSRTTYTITIDGDDYYESRTQSATIIVDLTKYVRIWSNGAWHRAIPYVYYKSNNEQNARWHKAEAYVYNNNAWKITRS